MATKKVEKVENEKSFEEIAKETQKAVKSEKTIKVKFPLLPGKNVYQYVEGGINGVDFRYKRGEIVDVPETVYQLLEETGVI